MSDRKKKIYVSALMNDKQVSLNYADVSTLSHLCHTKDSLLPSLSRNLYLPESIISGNVRALK